MPTLIDEPDSADWRQIRDWRKRVRKEFLERRGSLDARSRHKLSERACALLLDAFDLTRAQVLGVYWPIRGEIDILNIAKEHLARGGEVALPTIGQEAQPIEFWRWRLGMPMQKGAWNIPMPKERDALTPDALIIPVVGFDLSGFRLGYGGGYFDRTLAAAKPQPYPIGLGYEESLLPSIYPQSHDIPMDSIVTEHAVRMWRYSESLHADKRRVSP